jgi:hypothetical protein
MDHRRGHRWRTKLAIRITTDQTTSPRLAWLQDLSHHGARLRLCGGGSKLGKTITVWLPEREEPIRALMVHSRGDTLGLLWIEYSPWVDQLLARVIQQTSQPRDDRSIAQGTPAYASQLTVGFDLQRTWAGIMAPSMRRRK